MAPVSSISGVTNNLDSMNLKSTQGQELTPFRRQSAAKDKLDDLVKQNRNFSIIYGGFRANHNIHALCSLYNLGAPASYLQRYFDDSKTYLEPATKELYTITEENWEEHIGKKDAYSSFLKYFDGAVEKLSMLGALKRYVPRLIPGFTGAALHPMIHLGYSVEFDLPLVAAEGLAYAASYYSPIGEAISKLHPEAAATQTPPSSLDLISGYSFDTANIEGGDYRGNNLDTKIHHVVNQFATDIVGLGNRWACTEENFEERAKDLTLTTVKIFGGSYRANTLDFFLLHGLTGNHAVNTLLPILDVADRVRLLNLNFLALTILYLVQGAPSLPEAQLTATTYDGSDMPWQEIIARASEKNDSHVIKGVRCLHQLEVLHGAMGGIFHRPAAHSVLDVLKNDWCFRGIGLLPSN